MSRARTGAAGRKRERGQILVLFTLGLVVFLGVSALAIDFGVWLSFHRFYQNVTDAATLAGAPFLTRPLSAPCGSASKDFCARREAWRYLNDSLDLGLGGATLDGYAASNTTQDAPVLSAPEGSSEPYAIWVDTPPGAAGAAYRGIYPDDKRKIWARVDRVAGAFFSRVFCAVSNSCITDRTVTGWATAGAFPNAWAVITLRRPGQAPGDLANDITISGSNSRLEVVGGDIGGNWNMKLNSDAQLWVRGETDNEADTYLTEWQSCGSACWNAGQVSSGPNGNPAYVTNQPDPLPGFIQDPSYALPAGVDANGGATPLVPKGTIGNGQIDVDNGAPGGTIVHGIQPLTCDPASPRIGPGYYTSITVRSGKCLILDPITDWTDWTSNGGGKGKGKGKGGGGGGVGGQVPSAVPQNRQPGIFFVDGPVDVNQNAMIVGDGVTLVLRPAPTSDTQNQLTISSGGIVSLNNGETPAPPAPNQQWVPDCLVSNCRLGAWMTNGSSPYLWSNSHHSWAYQSPLTTDLGNIGIALYVIKREQYKIALPDDSSRVVKVTAGAAFTWQGVTYAPHDNVTLAGQPGHDGFGQLVSWTLRFVGGSPVRQTFAGPESSTPRLFEPTIP